MPELEDLLATPVEVLRREGSGRRVPPVARLRRRSAMRRFGAGASLITIVAIAGMLVPRLMPEQPRLVLEPSAPQRQEAQGWERIPDAPPIESEPVDSVWTGEELVVWGSAPGSEGRPPVVRDGGLAYNPTTESWRKLPPAPVRMVANQERAQTAVWTGTELVVYGNDRQDRPAFASYDPSSDEWSAPIRTPFSKQVVGPLVWTGSEVVLWGGLDHADVGVPAVGTAYSPDTGTWRQLSKSPLAPRQWHTGVWTGDEILYWGGTHFVTGDFRDGAAYDPARDTWRMLPDDASVAGRYWHQATWTGSEMVVFGGLEGPFESSSALIYAPDTERWRVSPSPLKGRHWFGMAWTGSRVAVWGGYAFDDATPQDQFADGALYDPSSDRWEPLPQTPLEDRCHLQMAWTGSRLLVWGGVDGCGSPGADTLLDGAALAVPGAAAESANLPSLPALPRAYTAVDLGSHVRLVDVRGREVARLAGWSLDHRWRPGDPVALRRGADVFRIARNRLLEVSDEDWQADDPGADLPKAEPRGHWRWSIPSPDGDTILGQWSGECEIPTAYYVPSGGDPQPVAPNGVESVALGWTGDGRAIVHLPEAGCGSPLRPGVYLATGSSLQLLKGTQGAHRAQLASD